MATFNQFRKYKRIPKESFVLCPALKNNPQVRGRYNRTVIITPRKPNSALRKVGKVTLVNKKRIAAKVPGSGLLPQKFATVLVIGRGYKDTPSVKYSIVRGKYECLTLFEKTKKRSLYCLKNTELLYLRRCFRIKKNES